MLLSSSPLLPNQRGFRAFLGCISQADARAELGATRVTWVWVGGAMCDAAPLKPATVPPQKSLGWSGGRQRLQGTDPFGRCLLCLPRCALSRTRGRFCSFPIASAADGLSSMPPPAAEPASPVVAEAAGAAAPPVCEQKAAFCLCYFGLLQHFSFSWGTGVCRAGGICVAIAFDR